MQYRNTKQKEIILDVIEREGHITIDRIIELLKNDGNVSVATIYRNLNILVEEERIKKISNDDTIYYETIKNEHYHFQCTKCGQIYDINKDLVSIRLDKKITGIVKKDLFLFGICDSCKNEKGEN